MFDQMFMGNDQYGIIWSYGGSATHTWTAPAAIAGLTEPSGGGDSQIYSDVVTPAGWTSGDWTIRSRYDLWHAYFTGLPNRSAFGIYEIERISTGDVWFWVHTGPTDAYYVPSTIPLSRFAEIFAEGLETVPGGGNCG
jgi:hypothetical protein